MRDPRYRFSDDVRSVTRAIALRMIHAGEVASSPQALEAWIGRTDDLRERLTNGGYGTDFDAADLFPLFQGFVVKATTPAAVPSRSGVVSAKWVWVGVIFVVIVLVVVVARAIGS
jgi:hypothetical protein